MRLHRAAGSNCAPPWTGQASADRSDPVQHNLFLESVTLPETYKSSYNTRCQAVRLPKLLQRRST